MLKMGQMCHCREYWTLVSWDADGNERYKLDHFDEQEIVASGNWGLGILIDGTELYALGGAVPGEDDGRLQKWTDIDTGPVRAWFSDRNGQSSLSSAGSSLGGHHARFQHVAKASDGAIWGTGSQGTGAARWDSSGVQQGFISSYGTAVQEISGSNDAHVCHANSQNANATTVVRRYDNALSIVDSADLAALATTTLVHPRPSAVGFFATGQGGRAWDNALANAGNVSFAPNAVASAITDSGGHVYLTQVSGGGNTIVKYTIPSWTSVWTKSGVGAVGGMAQAGICDGSDHYYISVGTTISKRDAANGDEIWNISQGGGRTDMFRPHSSGLWLSVETGKSTPGVRMFDENGNTIWYGEYSNISVGSSVGLEDCRVDADGNIYLVGRRIRKVAGIQTLD